MNRWRWLILVVLAVEAFAATTQKPEAAAKAFWQAMAAGKKERAKALTIRGHIESNLPLSFKIDRIEVDEGNVTDGRAEIPTRLTLTLPGSDGASLACTVKFQTELLDVADRWRVDGIVTMKRYEEAAAKAAVACGAKVFDEMVSEGMRYFQAMQKALREQNGTIQETIRKWQDEMEKLMDQMQKELQNPPKKSVPLPDKGERI